MPPHNCLSRNSISFSEECSDLTGARLYCEFGRLSSGELWGQFERFINEFAYLEIL